MRELCDVDDLYSICQKALNDKVTCHMELGKESTRSKAERLTMY